MSGTPLTSHVFMSLCAVGSRHHAASPACRLLLSEKAVCPLVENGDARRKSSHSRPLGLAGWRRRAQRFSKTRCL